MQVKLNVNGPLNEEALTNHINTTDAPAFLVDSGLAVICKNRSSAKYTAGMTVGKAITKFISNEDAEKISKMTKGEVVSISITRQAETIGATVLCGEDCRLITLDPLSVGIYSSVTEFYGKMSGYDHNIPQDGVPSSAYTERAREITRIVLNLLDLHKEVRRLPCFNVSSALHSIATEIKQLSRKNSKAFRFDIPQTETMIFGSEQDFLLISIFLSTFCADVGHTAFIELFEAGNEAICRITAVGEKRPHQKARFTPSNQFFDGLNGDMGDAQFWSHLIRLIADSNLWDFLTDNDQNGNLRFTLRAPMGEPFKDIIFRDISNAFISRLFALFPVA